MLLVDFRKKILNRNHLQSVSKYLILITFQYGKVRK